MLLGVSCRKVLTKDALRPFRGEANDVEVLGICVDACRFNRSQRLKDLLIDDVEPRRETTACRDNQHAFSWPISNSLGRHRGARHHGRRNQRKYETSAALS